jgi:hypothetical protein
MKMFNVFLLRFIGMWGWIAVVILYRQHILTNWYIIIPLILVTTWWAFFMNARALIYKQSNKR